MTDMSMNQGDALNNSVIGQQRYELHSMRNQSKSPPKLKKVVNHKMALQADPENLN